MRTATIPGKVATCRPMSQDLDSITRVGGAAATGGGGLHSAGFLLSLPFTPLSPFGPFLALWRSRGLSRSSRGTPGGRSGGRRGPDPALRVGGRAEAASAAGLPGRSAATRMTFATGCPARERRPWHGRRGRPRLTGRSDNPDERRKPLPMLRRRRFWHESNLTVDEFRSGDAPDPLAPEPVC